MYPGRGFIYFGRIIKALWQIDFKGYIALECVTLLTLEDAARGALHNLKGMLVG
jgi:sugar phosphate isomerase/epimerase